MKKNRKKFWASQPDENNLHISVSVSFSVACMQTFRISFVALGKQRKYAYTQDRFLGNITIKLIIYYWIFTRDVTGCIHEVSHTSNAWYAALESAQAYNDHSFRWYDIKRHHQYYWLLGVLVYLIMEMLTNRTHYTMANYYFSISK